jgi:hypothetical protein
MQVDYQDLDVLLQIQQIDLAILQAKKARGTLPQRIEVVKVRKKRDEITPKLDQVIELYNAKQAQITKVEDEDRSLAEKQERAQQDIDKVAGDYRRLESHTKDMAGIAKRRVTLEEQLVELNAELAKIKGVRDQLEAAVAICNENEEKLRASYAAEDDALVARVRSLMAEKEELKAQIPDDLASLYEKTAAKTGGVALGKLEEDHCGVCRGVIEGGRLIQLRAQAPLGTCPNCKRLLIVED